MPRLRQTKATTSTANATADGATTNNSPTTTNPATSNATHDTKHVQHTRSSIQQCASGRTISCFLSAALSTQLTYFFPLLLRWCYDDGLEWCTADSEFRALTTQPSSTVIATITTLSVHCCKLPPSLTLKLCIFKTAHMILQQTVHT